jgi:hypothetical protein
MTPADLLHDRFLQEALHDVPDRYFLICVTIRWKSRLR